MRVVEADSVRVERNEQHAAVRQQHATDVLFLTRAHIRALDERVVLRVVEADGVRVDTLAAFPYGAAKGALRVLRIPKYINNIIYIRAGQNTCCICAACLGLYTVLLNLTEPY